MSVEIRAVQCGMIQENAYVVSAEGRDDCFVVDPGDDCPKVMGAVGERRVAAILLTHGHFDHILAVGELAKRTGAPVYVGEADMEMLDDPALNGYASLMGVTRMDTPPIDALPMPEALDAAGLRVRVIPTPGHSRGSVCLYLEDEGVLFSGDTLFEGGFGRLDLHGGSSLDMRRSLRRLFELPGAVRVYPGHGGATTIERERERYGL